MQCQVIIMHDGLKRLQMQRGNAKSVAIAMLNSIVVRNHTPLGKVFIQTVQIVITTRPIPEKARLSLWSLNNTNLFYIRVNPRFNRFYSVDGFR